MPPLAPQKRSVWPWLLGIGAVLVFIGIGLIILIFAIARITNDNNNRVANTNTNRSANRNANANRNTNDNTNTNANDNSNTRSSLTSFTDDFSDGAWGTGPSQYGNIWYDNEEYHMHAAKSGYIVMYSPDKPEYHDENATVRVALRSVDGDPPATGYGLAVHGEKKNNNLEDYSFLIYNGDNPKYKIVLHKGGS
jgi:cytoskeletal protein RodZ